jgi:hypothetical protein
MVTLGMVALRHAISLRVGDPHGVEIDQVGGPASRSKTMFHCFDEIGCKTRCKDAKHRPFEDEVDCIICLCVHLLTADK